MLWVAVTLPWLPLEAVRPPLAEVAEPLNPTAYALADHARILLADRRAYAAGVRPGCTRAHALMLAPELVCLSPAPLNETQEFEAVALALLAYTPRVVLAHAHTVLLEVGSGLRLFGGLRALLRQIARTVSACGHVNRIGCAPTPWGAWLLAQARARRAGRGQRRVLRQRSLVRVLDRLPVGLLPAVAAFGSALEQIGCETLGDLRRLPNAGVSRRFGAELLTTLAQAYGEAPDPRNVFSAPASFAAKLELMARVDSADALLFAARRLLAQLCGWLTARHAAVSGFELVLNHEPACRGAPNMSRLPIAWAVPSRDAGHLAWLLREKLNQIELAAPVLELSLVATRVVEHEASSETLFPMPDMERDSIARLVERLGARLGDERVLGISLADDHRPEAALAQRPWRLAKSGRGVGNMGHVVKGAGKGAGNGMPSAGAASAGGHKRKKPAASTPKRQSNAGVSSMRQMSRSLSIPRLPGTLPANVVVADAHEAAHDAFIAPFRTPLKAPTTCFGDNGPLTPNAAPRPAWLLALPQSLSARDGVPFYRTPLRLVAGPERIESGWWDSDGAARDYYIAADAQCHWYWVFRERAGGAWFLHGLFG